MESSTVSKEKQKEDTLRSVEVFIRLGLIFGLMIWCFQILKPFLPTIVWALIIAAALLPAFNWFKGKIKRGPGMSATLFTLIILTAILTPSFMLSGTLINTAQEYAEELEDGSLQVPPPPERVKGVWLIGERLYEAWGLASDNLEAALEKFETQIRKAANWLLRTAAGAGLGILQCAVAVAPGCSWPTRRAAAISRGVWAVDWRDQRARSSPAWHRPPCAASPRVCSVSRSSRLSLPVFCSWPSAYLAPVCGHCWS